MILIKNSRVARLFSVHAIVLYPFIFFADKNPEQVLINHELIHVEQIKNHGMLKFYFLYLKEYVVLRFKGKKHNEAYKAISFEEEAYRRQNENRLG